jgi:hypothetical protein
MSLPLAPVAPRLHMTLAVLRDALPEDVYTQLERQYNQSSAATGTTPPDGPLGTRVTDELHSAQVIPPTTRGTRSRPLFCGHPGCRTRRLRKSHMHRLGTPSWRAVCTSDAPLPCLMYWHQLRVSYMAAW